MRTCWRTCMLEYVSELARNPKKALHNNQAINQEFPKSSHHKEANKTNSESLSQLLCFVAPRIMHCQALFASLCLLVHSGDCAFKSDLVDGTYGLKSAQNFDAYLRELGVGFFQRQLTKLLSPQLVIKRKCPLGDDNNAEVAFFYI